MKKLALISLCLLWALVSTAQQKLVYQLQYDMNEVDQMFKVDTTADSSFVNMRLLKEMLLRKMQPERVIYTLNDSVIVMERSIYPHMRYIYSSNSLRYLIQETEANGRTSVSTMDLDHKKNQAIKVRYDVKRFNNETRLIMGYSCFRILVNEFKTFEGKEEMSTTEMWVTSSIPLPAFILAGFHEQVVRECPLEIRTWSHNAAKPHTTLIAESIE